jgi:hypothetical protein
MTRFGLISHSGDDLKVALPDGRQPVTAHLGVSSLIAWRAQNAHRAEIRREHRELVDQRDVHVAERVLEQFGELSLAGATHGTTRSTSDP